MAAMAGGGAGGSGIVNQLGHALSLAPDEHGRILNSTFNEQLVASTNVDQLRGTVPILVSLINSGDRVPALTLTWSAQALHLVLTNSSLPPPIKTALSLQALPSLARLLNSPSPNLQKAGLQTFASIYATLFREATLGTADEATWATVVNLKASALQLWRNGGIGSKIASIKVIQRIVQTQTRGTADPRLQRTAEPNLSHVKPNHAYLRLNLLEDEAHKLLEEAITLLFTSPEADLVASLTVALVGLSKARPALQQLIVTALTNWTPAALDKPNSLLVRSAEKSVRIALQHFLKSPNASTYSNQITDFLARQAARMEQAQAQARKERELAASRKRQLILDELAASDSTPAAATTGASSSAGPSTSSSTGRTTTTTTGGGSNDAPAKRRKLDLEAGQDASRALTEVARLTGAQLGAFDASSLPLPIVVDLVVANLQAVTDDILALRIADVKSRLRSVDSTALASKSEGPLDPLKQDLGDEELDMKAEVPEASRGEHDRNGREGDDEGDDDDDDDDGPTNRAGGSTNVSVDADTLLAGTALSAADLPSHTRTILVQAALRRICAAGADGAPPAVWVPLVARLVTRGLGKDADLGVSGDGTDGIDEEEREEREVRREGLRKQLFDWVVEDLKARMDFARVWLNEEWYVDGFQTTEGRPYERWLRKLLQYVIAYSDNNDKGFVQFFMDLPAVPRETVLRLGDMCTKPSQVQLGFTTLRDLALLRPPSRQTAVDVLLGLTSNPDKMTRNAAINTVKRWVPDVAVLSERVVAFSKLLFSRLEQQPVKEEPKEPKDEGEEDDDADMDMDMDDRDTPPPPVLLARVESGKIVEGLPPPTTLPEILQHVELIFALSVKNPELLTHVFESYARLPPFVQESIQALIVPVIKSLGVSNQALLDLIGTCPPGSDDLVLRTVNILADKGRLPEHLATVIRDMAHGRENLNPRLYMLVIAECDKDDIKRYIPRIAKLLNNTTEERTAIRSIFLSIMIAPSQQFGSSSNAPRTRQSELLTPVELMTLLHMKEKEIGLKQTIEAIGICLSMSDAFRAETLSAFMQSMVDEPVLPNLFLRTVLQASTQYKNLHALVSNNILNKLAGREIWKSGPLWGGFILVAKTTAPNSFNALLMLPPEQLLDVVSKQPALKEPLLAHALKKIGVHRERVQAQIDVLTPESQDGDGQVSGEDRPASEEVASDVVMQGSV